MNFMQKRRILKIREHFETKFDDAFIKIHTMTGSKGPELSTAAQAADALTLAYSQGVLKAVDLILAELEEDFE